MGHEEIDVVLVCREADTHLIMTFGKLADAGLYCWLASSLPTASRRKVGLTCGLQLWSDQTCHWSAQLPCRCRQTCRRPVVQLQPSFLSLPCTARRTGTLCLGSSLCRQPRQGSLLRKRPSQHNSSGTGGRVAEEAMPAWLRRACSLGFLPTIA